MSKYSKKLGAQTVLSIQARKNEGKKLSMITCYDAAFARIIDKTDIDMVLVGDSLGNVVLGLEDTTAVKMDDMVRHTAAVSRVLHKALLCADMPFLSYRLSVKQALKNAGRLVQEGGAQCVKLEGGAEVAAQVKAISEAGIPVIGHLGLTPQSVHMMGGYRVQARSGAEQAKLLADALALQEAGAFALVLEMVPSEVALKLTSQLRIPTIGIGAGMHCDGQVLVLHDLLGFDEGFAPKFLKKYADLGKVICDAVSQYDSEVKNQSFPRPENTYTFE